MCVNEIIIIIIIITSFDCLLFCINVSFPPLLACNLSLTLCCVCP
jgi:hypothetical protein